MIFVLYFYQYLWPWNVLNKLTVIKWVCNIIETVGNPFTLFPLRPRLIFCSTPLFSKYQGSFQHDLMNVCRLTECKAQSLTLTRWYSKSDHWYYVRVFFVCLFLSSFVVLVKSWCSAPTQGDVGQTEKFSIICLSIFSSLLFSFIPDQNYLSCLLFHFTLL